jgi:hypothetical protein
MGGYLPPLDDFTHLEIKICDLIEMNEYGIHEKQLGNNYAQPIIDDTRTKIRELGERLPVEDQYRLHRYFEKTQGVGLWLKSFMSVMSTMPSREASS